VPFLRQSVSAGRRAGVLLKNQSGALPSKRWSLIRGYAHFLFFFRQKLKHLDAKFGFLR
jgi:hypothetical protein